MPASANIDEFVDVIAVTGFLGSGKTTLIKALLEAEGAAGVAVMVSEFGEVGIDGALLSDATDDVIELANGCICCRVGGSLEQSLRDLLLARMRGHVRSFQTLFIETSGMSDPVDMVATLHARPVREMRYRMKGTVTAFDGQFGAATLDERPEAAAQLAAADCVVVTKRDLSRTMPADIIDARSPGTPLLRSAMGLGDDGIPVLKTIASGMDFTPATSAFRAVAVQDGGVGPRHSGVRSVSLVLKGRIGWPAFVETVAKLAGTEGIRLLRLKGIINVDGIERPLAVHGVSGILYPPAELRGRPFPADESRIVLIYSAAKDAGFDDAARAALEHTIIRHTGKEAQRAA